jgi:hypothetical protein
MSTEDGKKNLKRAGHVFFSTLYLGSPQSLSFFSILNNYLILLAFISSDNLIHYYIYPKSDEAEIFSYS